MNNVVHTPGVLPPISESLLIQFIAYCANTLHIKWCTIQIYISGLRFHYIKAGYNKPFELFDRMRYILKAVKRSQGHMSTSIRYPITFNILYKMCILLYQGVFSPYTDKMLACAFQLAFFGFLRCGEFTVQSTSDTSKVIRIKDIVFAEENSCFILHLRSTKTDQNGKGTNIKIFSNNFMCPVKTMLAFISLRLQQGATAESPLFLEFTQSVLTRSKLIYYLHHILCILGIDDTAYSGHSFRIGAATTAAAAGVPDHMIQNMGRWKSHCYTTYIRIANSSIRQAQNAMVLNTQSK